jgi:hypothetical protein
VKYRYAALPLSSTESGQRSAPDIRLSDPESGLGRFRLAMVLRDEPDHFDERWSRPRRGLVLIAGCVCTWSMIFAAIHAL